MRPVIIGAGHNGLVAAACLARAGHKPLVLERRGEVGGCAVTHEIHPGFRAPALAHAGVVRDDIARDLGLEQQGCTSCGPRRRSSRHRWTAAR